MAICLWFVVLKHMITLGDRVNWALEQPTQLMMMNVSIETAAMINMAMMIFIVLFYT